MRSLLPLFLLTLPLAAQFSPQEWRSVRGDVDELLLKGGEAQRKAALIDSLASEDSGRTAKALLELAAAADARRLKVEPQLAVAEEVLEKIKKAIRKKHGRKASPKVYEKDARWRRKRDDVDGLRADLETAVMVVRAVGMTIAEIKSAEGVAALVDAVDPAAVRARENIEVRAGVLNALWSQPVDKVLDHVLAFGADKTMPTGRARVLLWIGEHKIRKGYDVAVAALRAPQSAVARSAVAALLALGDPACVPELIAVRPRAGGLLAEEIELALNEFTGKEYFGAGAEVMWAGWWKTSGEGWLKTAKAGGAAPKPPPKAEPGSPAVAKGNGKKQGAAFYGIETRSNRIVFVLDRSGSMQEPVPQGAPVTGGRDTRVPGKTRIEVAQNQLMRTIRALTPDVKFAVVFFSHDVHTSTKPPAMVAATPTNKKAAIDWFMKLGPVGSTMTFDALAEALKYATPGNGKGHTDPQGADTIFLLSDGAPSTKGGKELLPRDQLEAAVKAFLEANRSFKCVVHTIGIGPNHGRELLQRLARETGGTYKAVGMN